MTKVYCEVLSVFVTAPLTLLTKLLFLCTYIPGVPQTLLLPPQMSFLEIFAFRASVCYSRYLRADVELYLESNYVIFWFLTLREVRVPIIPA